MTTCTMIGATLGHTLYSEGDYRYRLQGPFGKNEHLQVPVGSEEKAAEWFGLKNAGRIADWELVLLLMSVLIPVTGNN
jgi:hypothetical protein